VSRGPKPVPSNPLKVRGREFAFPSPPPSGQVRFNKVLTRPLLDRRLGITNPLIVRPERDHDPELVSTASCSLLNTEAAIDGRIVEGSDAGSSYSHGYVPACTPTRTASDCNGLLGSIEHQSQESLPKCSLPHLCPAMQRRALSGRASRCRESLGSCDGL
jgi:hypothetical protein